MFTEDDCIGTCLKCIECNYTELESSSIDMRELLASNDYSVHSIVNRPGNTALCIMNGTDISGSIEPCLQ